MLHAAGLLGIEPSISSAYVEQIVTIIWSNLIWWTSISPVLSSDSLDLICRSVLYSRLGVISCKLLHMPRQRCCFKNVCGRTSLHIVSRLVSRRKPACYTPGSSLIFHRSRNENCFMSHPDRFKEFAMHMTNAFLELQSNDRFLLALAAVLGERFCLGVNEYFSKDQTIRMK